MANNFPESPADLRQACEDVARGAGEIIAEMIDKPLGIKEKGYRDIVTDADLAAQEFITQRIRGRYPDHGFLTEEKDSSLPKDGPIIWIIDPVDGTTNYSRQVPLYAVSVAAATKIASPAGSGQSDQWEILAGAVHDPARQELFSAGLGLGSSLNGKSITVSKIGRLDTAAVSYDWSRSPKLRQLMLDSISRYMHSVRTIRATGSATLGMVWIACSRIDLYYNLFIGPWDAAAAKIIVQEAGGHITDLWGKPWQPGDSTCLFSNRLLHTQFLDLLQFQPGF